MKNIKGVQVNGHLLSRDFKQLPLAEDEQDC